MNPDSRHKKTIQSHRRNARAGSGMYLYHHEVHALFEELIDRPWGVVRWHPAADICENDEAFVIQMDLPGVSEQDIHITAQGQTLVVEGRRVLEHRMEGSHTVHVCERCEGKFARTFHFHGPVRTEAVGQSLQDGVLVVVVPKARVQREDSDG